MPYQKQKDGQTVSASWEKANLTEEEIDKFCKPFLKMFAEIAYRLSQKGIKFPQ